MMQLPWLRERIPASQRAYCDALLERVREGYSIAEGARKLGLDPNLHPEAELAFDLADRVQKLLGLPIADRLRELLGQHSNERAALIIAEELCMGRFGFFEKERALELGVRLGLAIVTEGVTVAPLQGISTVRIKKNDDGTSYPAIYFAGPMRSAGGTEAAFTLVIADHLRKALGLSPYRINAWGEDEVGRFIEELRIYEREVGNFQYRVSDEDLKHALLHLPVEADGVETDPVEVVTHRGMKRIATDRVRGGALRVINDGLVGRCRKLLKLVQELGISDWDWLDGMRGGRQQGDEALSTAASPASSSHFDEVILGRPVLSNPGKRGGFRLRYGRSFNTGLATVGLHPALSALLGDPFVVGTQIKVDVPGKAATVAFVDCLEPPIVRLEDGSVVKVEGLEEARALAKRVDKILHLGDLLISYGDFLENNARLLPSPYVEEWWAQEAKGALVEKGLGIDEVASSLDLSPKEITSFFTDPLRKKPSSRVAFRLAEILGIPLHPAHLFYWDFLSPAEVLRLRALLKVQGDGGEGPLILVADVEAKPLLERIGAPHRVEGEALIIEGDTAHSIAKTLAIGEPPPREWGNLLELLTLLAKVPIRRKSSAFIGVRMGRPEKAMPRRMKPPVQGLYPVAHYGGASRDILEAAERDIVQLELVELICDACNISTTRILCPLCRRATRPSRYCPNCGKRLEGEACPDCKLGRVPYSKRSIELRDELSKAMAKVGYRPKPPLKGVKGLSNASRMPEPLEKALLRNKYGLSIYKDGTTRFDATNAPLTHFRPKEIGLSLEMVRKLGYERDVEGRPLTSEDQLVELKIQDIILPEEAGEYLLKVAQFLDELLIKLYGLEPYYRASRKEDLIGHLVVGLAPHTSVGIVGRILGFTKAQVCFAHPYWHSAKRRDCDGDEDSVFLLLDALLNFSKEFLPAQIGGLMDAPLLIQPIVMPKEVQRQAHHLDLTQMYPLRFYELTQDQPPPSQALGLIEIVRDRLEKGDEYARFHFTHPTCSITGPNARSSYSLLPTVVEKLKHQMELADKLLAVDANKVASSVLRTHLLPDILGNMKAYASQNFRCKRCGERFRRMPIKGSCPSCGGELQTTVSRKGVQKYLSLARALAQHYDVGDYLRERLELAEKELGYLFPPSPQRTLAEFLD